MQDHLGLLHWGSVWTFLNPPVTEPLFPNLRCLSAYESLMSKTKYLLYMPFPSLVSLDVWPGDENQDALQGYLESFFKSSPNIRRFSIKLEDPDIIIKFNNFFSHYICRWRDLQAVNCGSVTLDVDALMHLSYMPALTELSCTLALGTTLRRSDSPLFFPNLRHLTLDSKSLDPISRLLSRIRLPAITHLGVFVASRPSKQGFSFFLASIQTSVIGHTFQALRFSEVSGMEDVENIEDDPRPGLGFEDLKPCMAFSKLQYLDIDFSWDVELTDSALLALVSAWPHLEHLFINEERSWNMTGGITPDGLLQLLRTCPSLNQIALTIDTEDYTEFHESPASLGLTLPPTFYIDVLESCIEEESVPAMAAFLAAIAPRPDFLFCADGCLYAERKAYDSKALWYEAYRRANVLLTQRSLN